MSQQSERSWYVGLVCVHCGRPVTVKAGDALFSQPVTPSGKLGKPVAWHFACREKAKT